jgi:rod shape-determining protein MreC
MIRRQRNRLFTLGLLILLALGVFVAGLRTGILGPFITGLMYPLTPLAGVINGGAQSLANVGADQQDPAVLQKRNTELEHTVANLQVEIVRLREIEQDYKRLSGLVNYASDHPDQTLVTADVVALDTSSYLRWVIINRGARDGISKGNPVISDLGLVGRVEDVAANAAWVRLEIDPTSTVNARLETSRAEGAISGELQGGLLMDLIPNQAVIQPGDLVLTSGLGGDFPAGIVIGQVTSVHRQPAALFQQADVRPTVDFTHLEIVSVITGFSAVDIGQFQNDIQGATPQP